MHTGEKPYKCNQCPAKFAESGDLTKHKRVHTGEKPFNCKCGKSFRDRSNLKSHMKRSLCILNGKREFKCNICDERFKSKSGLKQHQYKHGRKFVCKYCKMAFGTNHDLVGHYAVHSGNTPFECECGAKYRRQLIFIKHRQNCESKNSETSSDSDTSDYSSSDEDLKK